MSEVRSPPGPLAVWGLPRAGGLAGGDVASAFESPRLHARDHVETDSSPPPGYFADTPSTRADPSLQSSTFFTPLLLASLFVGLDLDTRPMSNRE